MKETDSTTDNLDEGGDSQSIQPQLDTNEPGTEVPMSDEPSELATGDTGEQVAANDSEAVSEEPAEMSPNQEEVTQEYSSDPLAEEPTKPAVGGDVTLKKDKPHRKVWFGIVASLLLLVGGATTFLTMRDNDEDIVVTNEQPAVVVEEPVTTLGAEIALTEGVVEISRDGADNWVETPGSESVANLDYIRTQDDSRAIILFDDGSVARLDENTEIYLSSLERDGLELTLVSGQVYSRVVDSDELAFTVVTANERFESLGTAFKTSTDGTTDELEVYQSTVEVKSENIEVTEGNSYNTDDKELKAIDLSELQEDEFAQWNKERDSENEEFKDKLGVLTEKPEEEPQQDGPQPEPQAQGEQTITLTGVRDSKGVKLSWTTQGITLSNGFKIVRASGDSTPTYGQNDAQYVGSKVREHLWWDDNGGSHYYRICLYRTSDSCDAYSNAVQVTSPKVEKEAVKSGAVNASISGNTLSWSLVGGNAPHGFKIVLSDEVNPVYPEDSILYSGPDSSSIKLNEKAGTYFVRVCKYNPADSNCVDYSEQIEYTVNGS